MKRGTLAFVVFLATGLTVGLVLLVRAGAPPEDSTPSERARKTAPPGTGETASKDSHPRATSEKGTLSERISRDSPSVRVYVHALGGPVAGARVLLFQIGGIRRSAETGLDGACAIANVGPGAWEIGVRHARYMPVHREVEIKRGPSEIITVELKQGARAFGRVTDSNGVPIAEARVKILDPERLKDLALGLEGRSDANGVYEIDGIPLGEVVLYYTSALHKPARRDYRFTRPGEAVEINVRLVEGNVVAGRVTTEAGVPIPGARITAGNEYGSAGRSDEEGRFAIHGLGDRPVHLSVSKRGYGTVYRRNVEPNTTTLVIRLPEAGSLSGHLAVDPLPSAFAVVLSRYEEDLGRELDVQTQTFADDGRGGFLLPNVAPGLYRLRVVARGYVHDAPLPVTVSRGQRTANLVVTLRRP